MDFNENALIKIIQPIVYRECDVKDKYLPIAASAAWDKCPSCICTCAAKLPWLLYIATHSTYNWNIKWQKSEGLGLNGFIFNKINENYNVTP